MSVITSGSVKISGSTDLGYKMNTDGLLLYLDTGNPNSYTLTGDMWYDISSNENDSKVPTFFTPYNNISSSFYTSGTDNGSYIPFDINSNPDILTIEVIYKPVTQDTSLKVYNIVFGFGFYNLMLQSTNTALAYNSGAGNDDFQIATGTNIQVNNWYYLTCEMHRYPNHDDNKLWINGVSQTLTSATSYTSQNFNNGKGRIAYAIGWDGQPYSSNAYYPIFKIYNRVLSQEEITNNYNYYKTRYPLL